MLKLKLSIAIVAAMCLISCATNRMEAPPHLSQDYYKVLPQKPGLELRLWPGNYHEHFVSVDLPGGERGFIFFGKTLRHALLEVLSSTFVVTEGNRNPDHIGTLRLDGIAFSHSIAPDAVGGPVSTMSIAGDLIITNSYKKIVHPIRFGVTDAMPFPYSEPNAAYAALIRQASGLVAKLEDAMYAHLKTGASKGAYRMRPYQEP